MTRNGRQVVCFLAGLLCCGPVYGITEDASGNPYQGIVERNVFGLKPPPPPPVQEAQLPPPPKVTITGITTIVGKKALLEVAIPAKGTEPARKQQYILAEGERDGDIEVLQIDEKTGDVKLKDFGTVMTLNIEKDGPKLASTPPPTTPIPGIPGLPVPNAAGGAMPSLNPGTPGKLNLPTRALRTAAANAATSLGSVPTTSYQSTPTPGVLTTPVLSGTPGVAQAPGVSIAPGATATPPGANRNWPPEVPMTPEEQAILIEVERERNANNPNAPPLPTTALTPNPTAQTPGNQIPPATIPPPPPIPHR